MYAHNEYMEGRSPEIDMLVISHFHTDHINGLPYLLKKFKVKKLVIPYLSEDFRLAALAALAADGIVNWTLFSELISDPRSWLASHGSEAELVEVSNEGDQRTDLPVPSSGSGLSLPGGRFNHDSIGAIYSGNEPIWLFKFYVHEAWGKYLQILCGLNFMFNPQTLAELRANLCDPAWITANHKQVKDVFSFLGSGKQNLTTLCMYSGVDEAHSRALRIFSSSSRVPELFMPRYWGDLPIGWLGTGDAELQSDDAMDRFEHHFSMHLDGVGTITIPHHGSKDNYSARLGDIGYRHVITSNHVEDPKGHHPAPEVMLNLNTKSHFIHVVTSHHASCLFDRMDGHINYI